MRYRRPPLSHPASHLSPAHYAEQPSFTSLVVVSHLAEQTSSTLLRPRSALMYNIYLNKILKYIIYMIVYCTARRS